MDLLEGVPVLQSLQDHAVFECEWCGHIALVRGHEPYADMSRRAARAGSARSR
jgi:hypothetical protein